MQLKPANFGSGIAPLFTRTFQRFGELGAAVSVWQNGKSILDLTADFAMRRRETSWTEDTIVLIWSATKGLGSACLLHVLAGTQDRH